MIRRTAYPTARSFLFLIGSLFLALVSISILLFNQAGWRIVHLHRFPFGNSSAEVGNENLGLRFPVHKAGELTVIFIDVGQGDSALIETPSGKGILVDGGPPEAKERVLAVVRGERLSHLEKIIISHAHEDHIGSLYTVLGQVSVGEIIEPRKLYETDEYLALIARIRQKGIPIRGPPSITSGENSGTANGLGEDSEVAEDDTGDWDQRFEIDGVEIEFLGPPPEFISDEKVSLNNASIVFRLTYAGRKILFTGDSERKALASLQKRADDISADILKVSHHGSSNGTTKSFLDRVRPKYAVISLGAGNSYGHPHKKTLDLLGEAGAEIFRTDINGCIVVRVAETGETRIEAAKDAIDSDER